MTKSLLALANVEEVKGKVRQLWREGQLDHSQAAKLVRKWRSHQWHTKHNEAKVHFGCVFCLLQSTTYIIIYLLRRLAITVTAYWGFLVRRMDEVGFFFWYVKILDKREKMRTKGQMTFQRSKKFCSWTEFFSSETVQSAGLFWNRVRIYRPKSDGGA